MCEFVSWVELDGEVLYLNDKALRDKRGRELKRYLGEKYYEDVPGHGAICWYYDIEHNQGMHRECTSVDPADYPDVIVNDIKAGNMSMVGVNEDFLLKKAVSKYIATRKRAWDKIIATRKRAWAKYYATKLQTFWELFSDPSNRIKAWR